LAAAFQRGLPELIVSGRLIFDALSACRVAPDEKDLQIALLRQQLRVLERKAKAKLVPNGL
jgi:hypothetical protein